MSDYLDPAPLPRSVGFNLLDAGKFALAWLVVSGLGLWVIVFAVNSTLSVPADSWRGQIASEYSDYTFPDSFYEQVVNTEAEADGAIIVDDVRVEHYGVGEKGNRVQVLDLPAVQLLGNEVNVIVNGSTVSLDEFAATN